MSIANIRDKIKKQLETIGPDVRIYPYIPTNPSENTFIYLHYDAVDNLVSYSKTLSKINFTATLCTLKNATLEQAQETLDPYVDATGDYSIRALMESLTPAMLSPDASHCHLISVGGLAEYIFNGTHYYGCKFIIEVYTI